jgi:hypothetical protein
MKEKVALKDKQLRKQINGKFNDIGSAMHLFLSLLEGDIQGHLHAVEANLVYFIAWFPSFQLP